MRIGTRLRLMTGLALIAVILFTLPLGWSLREVFRLEDLAGHSAEAALDRAILLLGLFICLGGVVTAASSALVNRLLSKRIAALKEGAEIIGNGNLDYRLEASGNDELVDLARMTNAMTTKLQASFTSLANLEREITERERAEKALRLSEAEKSVLNRIAAIFLTVTGDEMYGAVQEIVLEELHSRFGIFGYIAGNGDLVIPSMTRSVWSECQVAEKTIVFPPETWGKSIWGKAIREQVPFIATGPFHTPPGHIPIDSFITAPIVFGQQVIGLLSFANSEQGYSNDDKVFLEKVAASIAPILKARLQRDREEEQRKRAEEALKGAIVYNRSLIEASIDPLMTINADGKITDVNSATELATGIERSGLIGTDFCRYFTDPDMAREGYERVFREGTVRDYPLEILRGDGLITPVIYNAAVYRDEKGEVAGAFAAARDITERKALEAQLRQSQKMEAIGTLAGGIAHDFNNILTAIIGFASLLEIKMPQEDPLCHNVAQILSAAERATNLTRSLLAFSRKQPIETKVLDLNDIVTDMEKMLRRLIREDVELTITHAAIKLPVLVDFGQIEQVLMNLVANARDAMPAGGTLSLSTGKMALDKDFKAAHGYGKPGDYAVLTVSDTGSGMTETIRQRIFEPFFTTKEVGKGTGLGLAVCYGIVKQNDGYINCYSEPEMGTTFRIYLPLMHQEVEPNEQPAPVAAGRGEETILLAEDDATVRGLTSNILEEFGYSVIVACNGMEAVTLYRERSEEIDLCLFDVVMPKMAGLEALEEIRGIRSDVKALLMSGYQADFDRLHELTKSGAGFIGKPVMPRELLKKVREMLDR